MTDSLLPRLTTLFLEHGRATRHDASSPLPVLAGPTCVGKTSISIAWAAEHRAEIISADSRQIYRGLDIGTAKPSPPDLRTVPHHFIDELEWDEPYSAGRFARDAYARITEVLDRGHLPLVVGGSTLYLHALVFGLADVPRVPATVRRQLEERLEHEGSPSLFAELQRLDPEAAASMDATKTHRLIRALEVYHGTGRPLSSYHEEQPEPPFTFRTVVLNRERSALYARINRRVDEMVRLGLLGEVRGLLDRGVEPTAIPMRTIGYREALAHLRGECSFDEMVRLIKRNTRRYAKRQLTWFRRYSCFFELQ